jgi:hypothetical protein
LRGDPVAADQISARTGVIGENRVREAVMAMPHLWRRQDEGAPGIDSIIDIFRKSKKTGWIIYVQVKSGSSFLKSETDDTFVVRAEAEDTEYWSQLKVPVVFVWCDTSKKRPRLFWAHINKKTRSKEGWRVYISKKAKFGSHSSGDLYRLAAKYYSLRDRLPRISDANGPHIPVRAVKKAALEFYKQWQREPIISPALGEVRITRRGWRHITAISRTQRSVVSRLALLGAAKEILARVGDARKCRDFVETLKNGTKRRRVFYIQTAVAEFRHRGDVVVSVITEQLDDGPISFYGVYEDWGSMPGGEGSTPRLI